MARVFDSLFPAAEAGHALRMDDANVLARTGLATAYPAPPPWEGVQARSDSGDGPRVLLLTSSLGSGHVRAAQAIELAVRERNAGSSVMTLDFWSLMDEKVAWAVRTAYLRLVQEHPALFDRIYQLDQRMWRAILECSEPPPAAFAEVLALMPRVGSAGSGDEDGAHYPSDRLMVPLLIAALSGQPRATPGGSRLLRLGLVQTAWARLSRRLAAEVRAFDPDVIVATQMNSAALLSREKEGPRIPTVGVPTDFGLHDFWIQTGIEYYCLAHDTVNGVRHAGLDADKVIATGIPLMPGFRQPPSVEQARQTLGLDPAGPVVLVAGGGLGLGVHVVTHRLLAAPTPVQVLVIAGHNDAARRALAPLAASHPKRLHVRDWTDSMELYMRAADIVVGKPGGLTVAEVLACGRPLLATRALGGQEGFNVRFLESHGVGRLVAEAELVEAIGDLLANPDALRRMQERAWALGRRTGADRIAELAESLAGRRSAARLAAGQ
ncbi:MAG TPA: glycosyltransferase [Burkholderiales bacterium]